MDIILALITAIIIYLSFRVLEAKFPRFNFTIVELIHGKFNIKNVVASIVVPFAVTLIFGLIYSTKIPAAYTIPGFLAALLIVWPSFRNPENIPADMQMEKERAYIVYLFFIASFTLFSYLGGVVGSGGVPVLPSAQGVVDGFWIVFFGAIFTHFAHRFLNKKYPPKPTARSNVKLPQENNQPLQP